MVCPSRLTTVWLGAGWVWIGLAATAALAAGAVATAGVAVGAGPVLDAVVIGDVATLGAIAGAIGCAPPPVGAGGSAEAGLLGASCEATDSVFKVSGILIELEPLEPALELGAAVLTLSLLAGLPGIVTVACDGSTGVAPLAPVALASACAVAWPSALPPAIALSCCPMFWNVW